MDDFEYKAPDLDMRSTLTKDTLKSVGPSTSLTAWLIARIAATLKRPLRCAEALTCKRSRMSQQGHTGGCVPPVTIYYELILMMLTDSGGKNNSNKHHGNNSNHDGKY